MALGLSDRYHENALIRYQAQIDRADWLRNATYEELCDAADLDEERNYPQRVYDAADDAKREKAARLEAAKTHLRDAFTKACEFDDYDRLPCVRYAATNEVVTKTARGLLTILALDATPSDFINALLSETDRGLMVESYAEQYVERYAEDLLLAGWTTPEGV